SASTTETPVAASTTTSTVTHTPTLPSSASTTAAAQPVTTAAAAAAPNAEFQSVLAALNGLKASMDDRLKNVVTMDKVNELGATLLNEATTRALRQAD